MTEHDEKRPHLEAERARLLRRIDELTVGGEIDMDFDDDFADRGSVASEKGENRTVAHVLKAQLILVDHALERLSSGAYGTCEICGRPIGAARLDALPATDRCIEHA